MRIGRKYNTNFNLFVSTFRQCLLSLVFYNNLSFWYYIWDLLGIHLEFVILFIFGNTWFILIYFIFSVILLSIILFCINDSYSLCDNFHPYISNFYWFYSKASITKSTDYLASFLYYNLLLASLYSVSYTHLDVYKRQG